MHSPSRNAFCARTGVDGVALDRNVATHAVVIAFGSPGSGSLPLRIRCQPLGRSSGRDCFLLLSTLRLHSSWSNYWPCCCKLHLDMRAVSLPSDETGMISVGNAQQIRHRPSNATPAYRGRRRLVRSVRCFAVLGVGECPRVRDDNKCECE